MNLISVLLSKLFKIWAVFLLFSLIPFLAISQSQLSYTTNEGVKFLVHLPENYSDKNSPKPLLLFLHGMGERGDEINQVKRYGPPQMIENGTWSKDLPFIVISPQLPEKYGYWPDFLITHLINYSLTHYNIDERRIYLTGLSLGGMGTWNYALHQPEKIAAIIPVCGKADPSLACNLETLPVWAFHGDQDKIVDPQGSIKIINALKECKERPKNITKFTLYPGVKHDSWTRTYNNPEIYKWLLQFKNNNIQLKDSSSNLSEEKATLSPSLNIKKLCTLPVSLKESSGLQSYNSFIWTHNDSGNLPVVFQIDSAGKIIQFKTVTNSTNYDWEDLGKDEIGNLYIGDFGNNKNNRKNLQIYIIPDPNNIKEDRVKAEVITFTYSDQKAFPPAPENMNYDVEAMIVFDQNIYLFSKNNTNPYSGYVKLYKLPATPGEHIAEVVDSLFLGNTNMFDNSITGADISPDKKNIVLLTYSKIWLLNNFEEDNFFKGDIIPIQLPTLSQKEGITFKNNTEVFISDERFKNVLGGNLYLLNLSPHIPN